MNIDKDSELTLGLIFAQVTKNQCCFQACFRLREEFFAQAKATLQLNPMSTQTKKLLLKRGDLAQVKFFLCL